jgi:hypothetical protein
MNLDVRAESIPTQKFTAGLPGRSATRWTEKFATLLHKRVVPAELADPDERGQSHRTVSGCAVLPEEDSVLSIFSHLEMHCSHSPDARRHRLCVFACASHRRHCCPHRRHRQQPYVLPARLFDTAADMIVELLGQRRTSRPPILTITPATRMQPS